MDIIADTRKYKHYILQHEVMTPAEVGEALGVSRQLTLDLHVFCIR